MGGNMRLRNKRTGEIINAVFMDIDFMSADDIANCPCDEVRYYHSLAELNAEWEDYKPKEPLIKDEKARSVLAKWFDLLPYESATYRHSEDCLVCNGSTEPTDDKRSEVKISFDSWLAFKKLKDGESYTRAELCGEEE